MPDQIEIAKALRRAEKLLRLANGTDYAEEAESALRHAEKILAKYNLSMRDLDEDSNANEVGELEWAKYGAYAWQRSVVSSICQVYGVFSFHRRIYRKVNNVLIGKEHNVKVAVEMSGYVVRLLQKLCREAKAKQSSIHANSFYQGASYEIRLKCLAIIEGRTQPQSDTPSDCTALVLNDEYDTAKTEAYAEFDLRPGRAMSSRISDSAFRAGQQAGKSVNLDSQLN